MVWKPQKLTISVSFAFVALGMTKTTLGQVMTSLQACRLLMSWSKARKLGKQLWYSDTSVIAWTLMSSAWPPQLGELMAQGCEYPVS